MPVNLATIKAVVDSIKLDTTQILANQGIIMAQLNTITTQGGFTEDDRLTLLDIQTQIAEAHPDLVTNP